MTWFALVNRRSTVCHGKPCWCWCWLTQFNSNFWQVHYRLCGSHRTHQSEGVESCCLAHVHMASWEQYKWVLTSLLFHLWKERSSASSVHRKCYRYRAELWKQIMKLTVSCESDQGRVAGKENVCKWIERIGLGKSSELDPGLGFWREGGRGPVAVCGALTYNPFCLHMLCFVTCRLSHPAVSSFPVNLVASWMLP